jgi:type II secretory pathway pseudopilin PulG
MDATMNHTRLKQARGCRAAQSKPAQAGFSLLEVLFAGAILTIGLLALVGLFATALAATQDSQSDTIARERAMQTLESIYTARQTSQLTFADINNTTTVPPGQFLAGMRPLSDPGPDGLDDTIDDITPPAPYKLPGPDGVLHGTAADLTVSLQKFQRQVLITNVPNADGTPNPNLKQIVVTVQYPAPNGTLRPYSVQALVSSFR